jgi:YVTN family beta-propeller protein
MKTMKLKPLLYASVIVTLLLSSCKKPDKKTESPDIDIPKKVYVLNEGNFGSGNSSVSIYDQVNNKVYNNLFFEANSRPLGDVLQSMSLINGKAYFVVNNSNKIEVTGTYPLAATAVIYGVQQPRYITQINSTKAYLTEQISFGNPTGKVSVIDLTNNVVTSSITVGAAPERMLLYNGKIYVCISGEDKITIINAHTNVVEGHITVSDGPKGIIKDVNGMFWVLCGGKLEYDSNPPDYIDEANSTPGALVQIDPSTGSVVNTLTFSDVTGMPGMLTMNGSKNKLYYSYLGGVYSQDVNSSSLSSTAIIERNFYGMNVDPVSNIIYIGTYGFTSNQKMVRYTANGIAIDSLTVGIGPSGFVFNY